MTEIINRYTCKYTFILYLRHAALWCTSPYIIWSAHNSLLSFLKLSELEILDLWCHSNCLSFQNFIWIPTNMQFSFVLPDYCYMYFLCRNFRLWMLYRKVKKIGMQTYCTRFKKIYFRKLSRVTALEKMELSSVKKTKIRAALENKYMSSDEEW